MTTAWASSPVEAGRAEAARRLAGEPAPLPTLEAWRRTDFRAFALEGFRPESIRLGSSPDSAPASGDDLSGLVYQRGSGMPLSRACAELSPRGLVVTELEAAAARWPDLVLPHLGDGLPEEYRKLGLANAAGWRGGAFVHIPKGLRSEAPIRLRFEAEGPFCFPRVLVIVEPGAEFTVVEEHASAPEARGTCVGLSRLVVGDGARVRYFTTQELGGCRNFWAQRAVVGREAQLTHASVVLGGELHKSFLDVEMAGRGGRCELYGILFGRGSQHFDSHTRQHQVADHTYSDLLFRSALKDKARSIYTGLIRIEREAKETDAYQANHNLLLSPTSRADSTPILEILTDAVRCKHGATAGPLSKEELFYLAARGLPEEEARRMLIMGFFEPILKRLPLPAERERLSRKIEEALECRP